MANNLPLEKKILVLNLETEGQSIRATQRITGGPKHDYDTFGKGRTEGARDLDREMVNLKSNYMQVDEIWCTLARSKNN